LLNRKTVINRERTLLAGALVTALVLALSFSACGGEGATEVKVGLKEWSVTTNVAEVKPGKVRFVVTNDGTEPHEMVVIRSDLGPAALPVVEGKVDEDNVDVVDEIESFAARTTEQKTVDLRAGRYVLICNIVERVPGEPIESHYEKGMRTEFLVCR
jgi:uncharacterized cupredoxin-like copper-binding protein